VLRWRRPLVALLVAGAVALLALSAVVVLRDNKRSYTPDEVSSALARQGLDVSEAVASGEASALLPRDESFTVLVLESDDMARDAYEPYEDDVDPDTFEALAGNVIVLADGSNAPTPLPRATRARIMRALDELGAPAAARS
jgi:hypothetical protein